MPMQFITIATRRYARFERLQHQTELVHAFSIRPLNVAPRPGGDAEQRAANRAQMADDLGLDAGRLCHCQQVHDTTLAVIQEPDFAGALPHCDGVATNLPGVPLMSFSADCPLLLLFDPVHRAVGLVHASWRCTVAQLGPRMVELLRGHFGSRPADLLAGIGPGAGPCCYEVKQDVYTAAAGLPGFESLFVRRARSKEDDHAAAPSGEALYFDLWEANRQQLIAAGLAAESIEVAGVCTMCHTDLFYSFRREGQGCGHFGLMAALRA